MRYLKTIKNVLAFLMLMGFMTACNKQVNEANAPSTIPSQKIQNVEVVTPQNRSFTAEVLIAGTARPNQVVMLYAMERGILSQIRKDIGDHVRKGETIAILENPELVQERMKLKAELNGKKSIYERLQSVYEKTPELTTIQRLENAESEYLSAKASLRAVNNRISFLSVKAPFSGTITKRFVDNGALLQNGLEKDNPKAIVEIQDTDPIRLTLPVPESDAVAIKKGMPVRVLFPELPGEVYDATISRISHALDPQSRTMKVEIDLENPNGKIITGMYAKVRLRVNSRKNILSLPMRSKVRYQNEDYVLVVENKIVKRLPIRIGLTDKDYFETLNAAINSESRVIINGKGLVKPGQVVNPIIKSE